MVEDQPESELDSGTKKKEATRPSRFVTSPRRSLTRSLASLLACSLAGVTRACVLSSTPILSVSSSPRAFPCTLLTVRHVHQRSGSLRAQRASSFLFSPVRTASLSYQSLFYLSPPTVVLGEVLAAFPLAMEDGL